VSRVPKHAVDEEFRRLERLARLMDSAFELPGVGWRIGLDPIIGLIPGVGDLAGAAVSAWIVRRAGQIGARRRVQVRMLGNVLVETVVGTIPLLGDAFDAAFRANERNLRLLRRELGRGNATPPEASE